MEPGAQFGILHRSKHAPRREGGERGGEMSKHAGIGKGSMVGLLAGEVVRHGITVNCASGQHSAPATAWQRFEQ